MNSDDEIIQEKIQNNKIEIKDLITVGVFTALYFIVFFPVGMLGYIPIMMLVNPFLCPAIAGIPMMLYYTKIKKFVMLTITGIIMGLLFLVTGHSIYTIAFAFVFGILGDLILKSGNYKDSKKIMLSYAVFSLYILGNLIPIFILGDEYYAGMVGTYTDEYIAALRSLMTITVLPLLIIEPFLGGIAGFYLGRAILKKHFIKAGLA